MDDTIWLTFLEFGQSLQEFVGATDIRFDVQFLVAQPTDKEVQIFEVYRVASGTPLRIRLFGASGGPLSIPPYSYLYHRRRSLEGHVMKTASLNVSHIALHAAVYFASASSREKRILDSSCLFVSPSVRTYHLGPHRTEFRKIPFSRRLLKSVMKIQIWL
jgi:hypothetical protein